MCKTDIPLLVLLFNYRHGLAEPVFSNNVTTMIREGDDFCKARTMPTRSTCCNFLTKENGVLYAFITSQRCMQSAYNLNHISSSLRHWCLSGEVVFLCVCCAWTEYKSARSIRGRSKVLTIVLHTLPFSHYFPRGK